MAVKIRTVEKDDKDQITNLVKEFVESLNQPFYESLWLTLLDSYFVGLEIKELAFSDIKIFCAELDSGKLCGLVVAEIETDLLKRRFGDISLWYVSESCRGQKVGYQLLQAAIEFLKKEKKVDTIETNVREETKKALKIFTDLGFKPRYTRLRLDV
ncbi:MAG: GNAT family N-acetyltransferase [Candidatus Helarchaeota archaeon]